MERKRRTREHVIGDIGLRYAEYQIALAGFTSMLPPQGADYGIDIYMFTFDADGFAESDDLRLQVRSSEAFPRLADGHTAVTRVDRKHWEAWNEETYPVILVLYEASSQLAGWVNVKEYEMAESIGQGETITVHCDMRRSFDVQSIVALAEMKRRRTARLRRNPYDD